MKFATPVLAAVLGLTMSMAHAGGPVVIADDLEAVAEKPASSMGILPVILVAVALCAALCGGDEEPRKTCTAVDC